MLVAADDCTQLETTNANYVMIPSGGRFHSFSFSFLLFFLSLPFGWGLWKQKEGALMTLNKHTHTHFVVLTTRLW